MKLKLRWLFGLLSTMGLGYFIYQGSANYIVLSLIMFSFSAFVITFANFVINKNYDINMIEKHTDSDLTKKDSAGGYFVTKRDIAIILLSIILICGASFMAGRASTNKIPVEIKQEQTININNKVEEVVKIDINHASKAELMSLNGIGEKKADLIIANQPYNTIYGLLDKDIIGEDTFNVIKEVITIE